MKYIAQNRVSLKSGFTLIEVLVTMVLFMTVLIIASNAFNLIVAKSSATSKMEESNIEGVIGLEIMRHDLAQMGFGLPWGFSMKNAATPADLIDSDITYSEATNALGLQLNDSSATNSNPTSSSLISKVPRALVGFSGFGNYTSDYFAIKGTTVGRSKSSQRWTYIPFHNYSASPARGSVPVTTGTSSPVSGDQVVFVNSNVNDLTNKDHRLIVENGNPTSFSTSYSSAFNGINSNFLPLDDLNTYMVYGVDDSVLRMPFNRTDFFIGNTIDTIPPFCAPRTGILYRAAVNHGTGSTGGSYNYLPLLDCVADMQVVLGWDISDDGRAGEVNAYSTLPKKADGTVSATPADVSSTIQGWLTNAKTLREHLKVIKVYILAQEGKYDRTYTAPSTSIRVGPSASDMQENNGLSPVKVYTLTEAQTHYRWKLYRIVVRPKNLYSNQR